MPSEVLVILGRTRIKPYNRHHQQQSCFLALPLWTPPSLLVIGTMIEAESLAVLLSRFQVVLQCSLGKRGDTSEIFDTRNYLQHAAGWRTTPHLWINKLRFKWESCSLNSKFSAVFIASDLALLLRQAGNLINNCQICFFLPLIQITHLIFLFPP